MARTAVSGIHRFTAVRMMLADESQRCIGTYTGDTVVEIDYPLAFANAVASRIRVQKKRFRYVHLGGGLTESDQEKPLWFYQTARRVRGLAETKMKDFGQRNDIKGIWETLIVKPMAILPKGSYAGYILSSIPLIGFNYFIRMEESTATMVDLVVNDSKDKTLTNRMIITKGRELLKGMP
ncbi:hypothetical protein MMC21_008345 [Puttea exsequens]|nr:hypothetical protein [Puttea exsequens]